MQMWTQTVFSHHVGIRFSRQLQCDVLKLQPSAVVRYLPELLSPVHLQGPPGEQGLRGSRGDKGEKVSFHTLKTRLKHCSLRRTVIPIEADSLRSAGVPPRWGGSHTARMFA